MGALSGLRYIARGLLFAAIGLGIGIGVAAVITQVTGRELEEPAVAIGYVFALIGWLLGVGVWGAWAREWLDLETKNQGDAGWKRYFGFSLDHKVIGIQYLTTLMIIFLLAGLLAVLLRIELLDAGESFLSATNYNTAMSLHGIMMVAVAVATIIGGFGNFTVPLMIGAEDVAFPRINALSFWVIPPVALLLMLTPFFGGFDSGWTAYPPLSIINENGQLLFLLAFATFGLSSILGGLNFIATIITLRAPGMTWGRLPIFVWSIFSAALLSLTFTQVVFFGLLAVILDRVVGTGFFITDQGGNALLYEHIFWFYSHPAVYIMILPAFGIELEILSHFSRKPVFAYKLVVGALLSIVGLSAVVWAHHLFTSGMSDFLHIPFMVVTEIISIPTGIIFLSALGTIWLGRLLLKTPMLFALGVVFNFLIGGLTGIFLADVATDIQLQDTYFVVAHFHYTMVGGEVFAIMAAIYYWFPKMTGRMYNERLGRIHFVWMMVMYNVTFLAMFWVGIQGMNRRIADYPEDMVAGNVVVSVAAFLLAASFIPFVYNMITSWKRGPVASANPWGARTLEWETSSPPPLENFEQPPVVVGDPYGYGEPGALHLGPQPLGAEGDGD